jgi:predicted nuclease with TOPRIM domain
MAKFIKSHRIIMERNMNNVLRNMYMGIAQPDIEKFDKYINEYFIDYVKQSSQMDQTNSNLKDKIAELEFENDRLMRIINKMEHTNYKLRTNLEDYDLQCEKLNKKVSKLTADQENKKYFDEICCKLLEENDKLQSENKKIKLEYETVLFANSELDRAYGSLNSFHKEIKNENSLLHDKISQYEINANDKYEECDTLYKLCSDLTTEANSLQHAHNKIITKVNYLSECNDELQDENNRLTDTIKESDIKIEILERINNEMTNSDYPNKAYFDSLSDLESENKKLMEQNINLRDQLNNLKQNCIRILTDIKDSM